jgi:DNA (cytosine-5)-methyltransferase 1
MNYYNENDPFCCQWLRNLIKAGLIPKGDVDERSIQEVQASDLKGYIQCHFFTGIAGWPLALSLAGWPSDREIFTGSCPCQPFSVAGQRKGTADARHLWPDFYRLIRTAKPSVVMGEQVSGTDGYAWVVGVGTDMEREGYRFRRVDIPACGIGAPHRRNRLYWVANNNNKGLEGRRVLSERKSQRTVRKDGVDGRLALPNGGLPSDRRLQRGGEYGQQQEDSGAGRMDNAADARRTGDGIGGSVIAARDKARVQELAGRSASVGMGDTERNANKSGRITSQSREGITTKEARSYVESGRPSNIDFWSPYDLLPCIDGKSRRVEPGTLPLAHGVSSRMGRLRAYGNAIVPPLAAQVIAAYLDAEATEGGQQD